MDNDFDFEPDEGQPWEDDAYESSSSEDDDYEEDYEPSDDMDGDHDSAMTSVGWGTDESKACSESVKRVTAELPSYEVCVREARPNDPGQWEVDIINTDTGAEGGYKYVSAPTIYEALAKAVELVPSVTW